VGVDGGSLWKSLDFDREVSIVLVDNLTIDDTVQEAGTKQKKISKEDPINCGLNKCYRSKVACQQQQKEQL